jgi:hypothetical protein
MLDEVARWDDLVTGLRPMLYGAKGVPARCLISVGPTTTAKASSEGWCLRLRPNTNHLESLEGDEESTTKQQEQQMKYKYHSLKSLITIDHLS